MTVIPGGRVPLAIALAVLVIVAAAIAWWARLAGANARHLGDVPAGELRELFRGGIMGRHVMTSGPLVRLEFFDWGVRIRGGALSRWLVPTWEARYEELAIAELVTLPASRIAVWFRLRDGDPQTIGFLSDHSTEILRVLEQHGVQVNRAVTRVTRVDELYG
jgi:hypothetical protein